MRYVPLIKNINEYTHKIRSLIKLFNSTNHRISKTNTCILKNNNNNKYIKLIYEIEMLRFDKIDCIFISILLLTLYVCNSQW